MWSASMSIRPRTPLSCRLREIDRTAFWEFCNTIEVKADVWKPIAGVGFWTRFRHGAPDCRLRRLPPGWISPIWLEIAYIRINDREEPISLVFKVHNGRIYLTGSGYAQKKRCLLSGQFRTLLHRLLTVRATHTLLWVRQDRDRIG